MPFGYTKHLEDQGKSQGTVAGYLKTIDMFFVYLDSVYGKQKEIYEISPKDIKGFLEAKLASGNEVKTVNKHLTILKGFFDYLWKIGKAPIDPAVKIPRYKVGEEKPSILMYEDLLDILPQVIHNPDYNSLRKTIFILAIKGLRSSEFQIPKENVIDKNNIIEIMLKKHVVRLEGIEAEEFLSYYFEAQLNGSNYLFITRKHDDSIVPVENMSIYMHLNVISNDYDFPTKLTLNSIRHAYAYYLYTKERMTIEQIGNKLGIESESAANLVKTSQERHRKGKELLEIEAENIVE
ncbi:site-specific integrase [Aquibacillus sp. 3ASR75-11]|uniref:Site-specific integrase n=1 Tax=Terrihalobacillus insolitus TaxID=2950438 RepID=A0A9X3WUL2_9BACI|nr:site-specific integrase [Terrihalobacillus insolitus]MDC3424291.1 site-specific integrase [Terrihalobacillus insolitus]